MSNVRFVDGRVVPQMPDEELYFSPYECLLIERFYNSRTAEAMFSDEELNPPDEANHSLDKHEREEHAWTLYDEVRRHRIVQEGYLTVFSPVRHAWNHYTIAHEPTDIGFQAADCIFDDLLWNRLRQRPAITASVEYWTNFLDATRYDDQYPRLRHVAELRSDALECVRCRVPAVRLSLFEAEAARVSTDPRSRFWDVLAQTTQYRELDGLRARRLDLHIAAWKARVAQIRDPKSTIFDEVAALPAEYLAVKDEAFHRKLVVWVPDDAKEKR